MLGIVDRILANKTLAIILIVVVSLVVVISLVNIFAKFIQSLDYLSISLGKKIRGLFKFLKNCIVFAFKFLFFPITIYRLVDEHKFYKQFLMNNNEKKKVKDI